MKEQHVDGCERGWRMTGCEACNRAIEAHEELLLAAKLAQATIHAFMKNLNMKGGEVESIWQHLSKAIAKAEAI